MRPQLHRRHRGAQHPRGLGHAQPLLLHQQEGHPLVLGHLIEGLADGLRQRLALEHRLGRRVGRRQQLGEIFEVVVAPVAAGSPVAGVKEQAPRYRVRPGQHRRPRQEAPSRVVDLQKRLLQQVVGLVPVAGQPMQEGPQPGRQLVVDHGKRLVIARGIARHRLVGPGGRATLACHTPGLSTARPWPERPPLAPQGGAREHLRRPFLRHSSQYEPPGPGYRRSQRKKRYPAPLTPPRGPLANPLEPPGLLPVDEPSPRRRAGPRRSR